MPKSVLESLSREASAKFFDKIVTNGLVHYAMRHNGSTIALGLKSMTSLLSDEDKLNNM